MSVWAEVAQEIRRLARAESVNASPPAERFRVVDIDPLVLESQHGDLRLVQGDDDLDVRPIRLAAEAGDVALVVEDRAGDRVAVQLLKAVP